MACWTLSALGNHEGCSGPERPYSPICWASTAARLASSSSRGPQGPRERAGAGRRVTEVGSDDDLGVGGQLGRTTGGDPDGLRDAAVHVGVEHAGGDVGGVQLVVADHAGERP